MALLKDQIVSVENVLRLSLRNKFQNYNPEPSSMPFHTRLLGKDRLALYSFIHSLNTNFGTSFFEPVAKSLALQNFASAETQQSAGSQITSEAYLAIHEIMNNLTTATCSPNKNDEIEKIRLVCRKGTPGKVKLTNVDIKVISNEGTVYLFDIKTAKPNKGGFKEFKRTLLEWIAAYLFENPTANIQSLVAIPYNPYEPEPYSRWTMAGMLDLPYELKVAAEFWDFLGGEGSYQNLLDIFEKVGMEMRDEIDDYFSRFNKK